MSLSRLSSVPEVSAAAETLVERLRAHARERPDKRLYTFLDDDGAEAATLTFAGLDTRARAVAARLQELGAEGERALLLFPPGLPFVEAFFGCLYAGVIAVPTPPPGSGRRVERLRPLVADARPRLVLAPASVLAGPGRHRLQALPGLEETDWVATDELPDELAPVWRDPVVSGEEVAFLQYTSGSTSAPKGVMVAHSNLTFMERLIEGAFEQDESAVVVGWLPVYHDMGLIGNVLQPLWLGASCVLMSPVSFLRRPRRWLEAIARYRGTTSGGPDFAYDLCVRRIGEEERRGLDLSSWRVAFNGAEPVRAATLEHFATAFAPCGFRRESFQPCYGLAEATLLVSGTRAASDLRVLRQRVGCGLVPAGVEVRVVDPQSSQPVGPGEEGELWVAGPGVARGYWQRPEATAETFQAHLAEGGGSWLRTGDLGFLDGGELFVTGRLKDLIILRGRNHYPQDIELTVETSAPGLASGGGAAFSVEIDGEERLVVVQEVEPRSVPGAEIETLAEAIRRAVAEEHEAQVYEVVLLRPGALPKTSSGKVQRQACRRLWLEGTLDAVERSRLDHAAVESPEDPVTIAAWLCRQAAAVLGVSGLPADRPLLALGLDSLAAIELAQAVETELGIPLPLSSLLEGASLADLAGLLVGRAPAARRETGDRSLLSHGERGLWFLDRLAPHSAAYHLTAAASLHGDIQPGELRAASQALVDRHEALRTTFDVVDGEPVRRVHDRVEVDFQQSDVLGGFDLERGPLLRVRLFTRPGGERGLLFAVHHIVADFWSLGLLARQLGALLAGEDLGDPAPRVSDFAIRHEDERLWEYWRHRLGSLPDLDLPLDHPRPALRSGGGAVRRCDLGPDLALRLRALAHERGTTLYAVLLASFQTLLARLTGQTDLAVGSPAASRPAGAAETVGYLVNPIVLRGDLGGEPDFRELLDRTRRRLLEALDHQDFPLPLLAERLHRAGGDLFRAMLVFHRPPAGLEGLASFALGEADGRLRLGPIEIESLSIDPQASQLDLTLTVAERGGGLGVTLTYDTDLFDGTTAARWLEQWAVLLEGIVASPETPIAALPLMPAWERHQVLLEANDTQAAAPPWRTLHEAFERQAERTPGATALVWGTERLSYAELNRRADQLAERLRGLGAGPERVVGVCLPRTSEMVVALLAVLKAGAAHLPLDPAYAAERRELMLADSQACLIVTPGEEIQRLSDHPAPTGEGRLAYLIYTSGSTGRPKAVAIEHASAVRLVAWAGEVLGPEELAGVLASTSIGFDLSVFELFVPLAHGGAVILADNALALPSLPAVREVTLINTVPSAASGLLDLGPLPPRLQTVNLAGEPLQRALVDRLHAAGAERVLNLYGPSEDTTYSTFAIVEPGERAPAIGRPVAGSQAYVLDRGLRPLPLGVAGELCLGGEGLARGYFGRPELTAERFVPDPFSNAPGARLYRTGDLARRRPSGDLEYLGRLDRQVKVRGFRIEPGEIEAALLSHSWVREAVVAARGDALAAWLVPAPEAPPDPEPELRSFLAGCLPAPFVPSAFVFLSALPLTPNGKVDRAALPEPDRSPAGATAPRGPVEELLAGIWRQLLGVPEVGRDDSFFALGGHSLLATRVVARVREALGVELPVTDLFQEPRLAGLARRIESSQRQETALIRRAPRDRPLPLSFAQQRLWFLDRLEPGQAAYNLPLELSLHGPLDEAALARALGESTRRHEVLRTTFPEREDGPVQRVEPPGAVPLPRVDLAGLPAGAAEREAGRIAREEARTPFDLAKGPLLRARLLRLGRDDHRMLFTLHHIAADYWSLGILLRELGETGPLPELPIQYGDYAAWEREGGVRDDLLAWWRERLGGAEPLRLPTDRPRPAVRSHRGATLPVTLTAGLGREHGATVFMTLLAALTALLHRYTGQSDISVGTAVANRDRVELEGMVGLFVNTLVLRTDLTETATFSDLLATVREGTLAAYLRRDLPFDRLVEELQPRRDPSRQALFDVMLVLQNAPVPPPALPGVSVEARPVDAGTAQFDLSLSFTETGDGLDGSIEYGTDLFDAPTVLRLTEHLRTLLEAAVEDPETSLAALPLLTPPERHQVLREWNDPDRARETDLMRRFEAQAARIPAAVALEAGEIRLTYRDLNARANRLARALRERGVGPETTVALEGHRSPEMVISVLAVLKAGGAYVPLDPAWPEDRRALVLADAGPRVVLCLNEEGAADGENLGLAVDGDHPAYVLYTSGSTGRPKGVLSRRRSLSNYLNAAVESYALGPGDRFLQFASLSFDTATEEVLCPLLSGATIVLRDDAMIASPRNFLAACGRLRITVLGLPTAFWHELAARLEEEELAVPADLRLVIVGGEQMRPAALAAWYRAVGAVGGSVRLINSYGPTETTISLMAWELEEPPALEVPIGRPVFGATARVLSRDLSPVPAGVPGELFLGGPGLARGYLGRSDLTAERLLPDPWGGFGERLYRTGDRARLLPDGNLEYLGRADQQVKVRGCRVEPGEVEAALAGHPGVLAAAVAPRETAPGDLGLVAWVVGRDGDVPAAELRGFLRTRIPEYMVPSHFVPLSTLPLTPSGKVDRGRLPDPAPAAPASLPPGPADPVQEIVAGIWAEVLGREAVGADEDFFDLGGHSLLAARVVSRLRQAFGVELPLLTLFEAPTVAALARRIAASPEREAGPPLRRSNATEAPLSPSQERLWFLDRLQGGSAFYNLAGAVRLRGPLDAAALDRSLQEVVRRHGALRTTIHQDGEEPAQRIAPELLIPLPLIDLTGIPEAEARRLAEEDARRPFDLQRGPLLRALLLRAAPYEHVLVLALHHIVGDGWSLALLTSELAAFYGEALSLPEPPLQFADFARWQDERLRTGALDEQLAWWRSRLAGLPVLELPTNHPRPPVQTFRGAVETFTLPADLVAAARALGRSRDATLFMTLFAAFAVLLHRWSGQTDLAIGTDVAHRDRLETERVIGFFVNSLVLRTDLSGNPTFAGLLDRVRATTLEAYARQDVPFHKVVEAVRPVRDPSRNPLFQVMFILQNAPGLRLELPGLEIAPFDLAEGSSVFDLSLSLEEDAMRGLSGRIRYNNDLFEAATLHRLIERYEVLLRDAAARPEARLDALAAESAAEKERRTMETTRRKESKFDKLTAARPQAVRLSREELVRASPLLGEGRPPLLVEPAAEGVDLVAWAAGHRSQVEEWLGRHGGVLFRGFDVGSLARFQEAVTALSASGPIRYGERSSPRSVLEGEVYTSTDHPSDQPIVLHNEQSYTLNWPMKIAFFCVQPATEGGRTPIADSRRIHDRLSPAVREAFERRGVLYVRNYGDGLGLPWREVFQTGDRAEVERYCQEAGLEAQWKDGDRLRTRQVRPAIRRHPRTGEPVWFNHALFFHVSSLEPATRDALLAGLAPEDLPFNTFYGDGAPIEPEALAEVRQAFEAETVSFPWQKGDVLLLDNMLVAHGREPFSGPRRIAVAMAEPFAEIAGGGA